MTIDKVKMFLAICTEGNVSKAADALFVSQPAVSQGIKDLELSLGIQLFAKKGRSLELTREGQDFIPYAQQYVRAHQQAATLFEQQPQQLRIGSSMTIATYVLPQLVEELEKDRELKTRVIVNNVETIKEQLKNNQIDIALVEGELDSEDYIYFPLGTFNLEFVTSPLYYESINSHLDSLDYIVREYGSSYRKHFDTFCSLHRIAIIPKWECSNNEVVLKAILSNHGIGLLPYEQVEEYINNQKLIILNLDDKKYIQNYGLVIKRIRINEHQISNVIKNIATL